MAGKQSQVTLALSSVGGYTFPEAQVLCIPGSARNWSKWVDPVFQGYIDEGYAARDTATWEDVMRKIQLRFLEQLPVILLPDPYLYQAWWPWVKNYYGESDTGYFCFAPIWGSVWVDQAQMKKMGR